MVALCVFASSIHAKDRTACGTKDFKIGRWHSHFSHHTFRVDDPCDGDIVITKNTPDMQIWKGFLFFNRRYIPLREFLAGDEIAVHIDRPLKYRNRLVVFLFGTPGASVRIAVRKTCKPVPPPTVAFSAAPMAIHTGESSVLTWTSTNAESVTIDQGIGTVDPDGSISVSPLETTTYTIEAANRLGTATAGATVSLLNTTPLANPQDVETDEDSSIPIRLSGSDMDNEALTYAVISAPRQGVLSGTAPDLTYTPSADFNGTDAFVFKVHDATVDSLPATVDIQVNPVNDAPVAKDDTATTDENTAVTTGNLLVNDMDIDGDSLTVSGFTQGGNGSVISHGDGTFTYSPDYGLSGTDRFSYTVSDGHGGLDTGSVAVQVLPGSLSLEIDSPVQGQQFSSEIITVTGFVNRTDASVYVDGIAATVIGSEFTAENVPLVPGTNTISVLAEDGDDTQVARITVILLATLDLEPIQIEITSHVESDGSAKVSGRAMVTVANNGSASVSDPYLIVLFEDTNLSGGYEEAQDNRLGEATVTTGPGTGESINVAVDYAGQLLFRDNRMHVFVDSTNDVPESDERNNVLATRTNGIDLSASLLKMNDAACPDEIALTVRIGNAGDTSVQPGLPVTFYDGEAGNGGMPIKTLTTTQVLEPGQYADLTFQWPNPPAGMKFLYARADDDGTETGILSETDEENNQVLDEMLVCTSTPPPVNGFSGQVIEAVTGDFLPGVTVTLHEEENGNPGTVVDQTLSDEYGGFSFSEINPGAYILIADLQDYFSGQRRIVLAADETLSHQDMALSPVLSPGEFRIVLTWGENPADLEAHLTAPNPNGCRLHCFYWNPTISGASLEVDDKESYGPETITIFHMNPGIYRFYVHDFTDRNSAGSNAVANSGATVTIYSGSGEAPLIFDVPTGAGTVWHVFNLEGVGGVITPINKLTHQAKPGEIDFPRITSSPVSHATYGQPYVYQVEAEDPDQDTLTYTLLKGPDGMRLDPFSGLIEWTPTADQGARFGVVVRVNDGRCGADTQRFKGILAYLPVVHFEVTPCSGINPGGEITLTWQTERADTVVIDQGIGEVSATGSMHIPSPDQPIVFTLTAENGAGQVKRIVPRNPSIGIFSASCVTPPEESSILAWTTECAADCAIDQGIGTVSPNGSMPVMSTELPVDYTLTCSNASGMVSERTVTLECKYAEIRAFVPCCWSPGDPVTLEWWSIGDDNCSITPGIGSVPSSGAMNVIPSEVSTKYTIACNGAIDSVNVSIVRDAVLTAGTTALLPGESTTLHWKTKCYDACSFDQGIGEVPTSGSIVVTPDQLPTTFTLTAKCGPHEDLSPVTIHMPFPAVFFSVSPAMIKGGESATLTWTTDLATLCTIEPDIGEVPLNGSIAVTPNQDTMYTLTAVGPGGTIKRTATVAYIKPTASIFADPEHLDVVGQPTTLTWVFSNADNCVIDQGIGEVQLGGSLVVTPEKTTTYTITATGPGGTAKDRITVAYASPAVEIHADRETLDEDETAALTWTFNNADTCSIDQGVGEVQSGGSIVVDPNRTTIYKIMATGPGGTAMDSVTVTCLTPVVAVQADPGLIVEGGSTTLSWQADHAATCVIEPDIGSVDLSGSIAVSPSITKTYTFRKLDFLIDAYSKQNFT